MGEVQIFDIWKKDGEIKNLSIMHHRFNVATKDQRVDKRKYSFFFFTIIVILLINAFGTMFKQMC